MIRIIQCLGLSLLLMSVMFSFNSCIKDDPLLSKNRESYQVNFSFRSSGLVPKNQLSAHVSLPPSLQKRASTDKISKSVEQYLYYWSFNKETLIPDIRINKQAEIAYNEGQTPNGYVNGYAFDNFAAGKALSIVNMEQLIVSLPLENVSQLSVLGFTINSSNTGSEDFHVLYSNDGGQLYDTLSPSNHFTRKQNVGTHFSFDLDTIDWDYNMPFHVKIEMIYEDEAKAAGSTHIDNFYIKGQGVFPIVNQSKELYYWVFDYMTGDLVERSVVESEDGLQDLSLTLPQGKYITHFVWAETNQGLIIPSTANTLEDHYISAWFEDYQSEIYGSVDTLDIQANGNVTLDLSRYYNLVRFELTDTEGLDIVSKILITRTSDPNYYAPFDPSMSNPVVDIADIVVYPDFVNDSQSFQFYSFVGATALDDVSYSLDVYSGEDLIRTFEINVGGSANTQWIFRGQLLPDPTTGFNFNLQTDWLDEETSEF